MIKVLALIYSVDAPESCMWKTVTTSDLADITMLGCQAGMPQLADWIRKYRGYTLKRWACQIGARPERVDG